MGKYEKSNQKKSKHVENKYQAYSLIQKGLSVSGGKHSFIIPPTTQGNQNSSAIVNDIEPSIKIDNHILIIKSTPVKIESMDKYVKKITLFINSNKGNFDGVIIDFRDNTGGSIIPMLSSLSQFLPDGKIIGNIHKNNVKTFIELKDGILKHSEYTFPTEKSKLTNLPIALLQNENTGSSGEITLLSFRELKNTKTFGQPTIGLCTGDITYILKDNAVILLSVGKTITRTGEVFSEDPIEPDIKTDEPLREATQWLNEKIH